MYLGNPCSPRLKNQLSFSGFGPWNLSKLWLWLCQIVWWCRPKIQSSWKILSFIPRAYCFHWKFTGCCLQNRSFTGKFQMNELKLLKKSIFVTCLGGFHISIICSNWYFNCLNALYLNFSRTFFFHSSSEQFSKTKYHNGVIKFAFGAWSFQNFPQIASFRISSLEKIWFCSIYKNNLFIKCQHCQQLTLNSESTNFCLLFLIFRLRSKYRISTNSGLVVDMQWTRY